MIVPSWVTLASLLPLFALLLTLALLLVAVPAAVVVLVLRKSGRSRGACEEHSKETRTPGRYPSQYVRREVHLCR